LNSNDRVATEIEKVIVNSNWRNPDRVLPDADELDFFSSGRRLIFSEQVRTGIPRATDAVLDLADFIDPFA
jgi:hypothetical protein